MSDKRNEEQGQAGTSRRTLFKGAGMAAAAVGVGQVLGSTEAGAAPAAAVSASTGVALEVVDYVDGQYVVEAHATVEGTTMRTPLRLRDGLTISGSGATVTEDPYTGEILVKPGAPGDITVKAVAQGGTAAAAALGRSGTTSFSGASTTLATYSGPISTKEASVASSGGGACVSVANPDAINNTVAAMTAHMSPERRAAVSQVTAPVQSELRVRAAIMGNVIPLSGTQRQIRWQHARYYGTHDILGRLRFTYQSGKLSAATMTTLGGAGFFPARGENSIYCRMEMLDLGGSAFSFDPMVLPNASLNWPIYSTPMHLSKPVVFYDEAAPDREVMTILKNEMRMYDYNGVTIKKLGFRVSPSGTLTAAYQVTNQTDSPFTGRWMLIGDHTDTTFAATDKALTLGPARTRSATQTIEVSAPVRKRLLSQRVGFAVMSLSDPVVLGITPTTFKFPNG